MGDLDFGNEHNSDLRDEFSNNLGEYSTENVVNPKLEKIFSQKVDGLPTILENSTQEAIGNLQMVKNKTHSKKHSEIIDMSYKTR
jgi:hypothetical protein